MPDQQAGVTTETLSVVSPVGSLEGPFVLPRYVWTANGFWLLVLVLLSVAIPCVYVAHSSWFYCWDSCAYHSASVVQMEAYRGSFATGWKNLRSSMGSDYPYTYCQPLVPFLKAFGSSRAAYEVGVSLLYQLPFFLAVGGIAAHLVGRDGWWTFWVSTFLVFFMPRIWVVTLQGYPDTCALALSTVAVLLYLGDMRLRNWRRIVAIGICLGLAPLFRRHYAYDTVAFFVAAGVAAIVDSPREMIRLPLKACQERLKNVLGLGSVGVVSICLLLAIGRAFVRHVLDGNTLTLYESYTSLPVAVAQFHIRNLGWGTVGLALIGYAVGLAHFKAARSAIAFLAFLGGLNMAIWIFLVRQTGSHHTLHLAGFVYPGVLLAFWGAWESLRLKWRVPVFAVVGVFVVTNFAAGIGQMSWLERQGVIRSLFAASSPPPKRSDYGEMVRLVNYLRQITQPTDSIYVTGSSIWINDDLMRDAERQLCSGGKPKLKIICGPHIDSRDYYPLEDLLWSNYVVVTNPFRSHIDPDQQRVARVVGDIFLEGWDFSKDFELLPEVFSLQNGIVARVYKRVRPTRLATSLRTLPRIVTYVGRRPGTQSDWVVLASCSQPWHNMAEYHAHIGYMDREPPATILAHIDGAPPRGEVQGNLHFMDLRCVGAKVLLSVVTPDGKTARVGEAVFRTPNKTHEFRFSFTAPSDAQLLLTLAAIDGREEAVRYGSVHLDHVRVVATDAVR